MRTAISAAIFWIALAISSVCISSTVFFLYVAMPGATFPPPNTAGMLVGAAITLTAMAFAFMKLVSGHWTPMASPNREMRTNANFYRFEDEGRAEDDLTESGQFDELEQLEREQKQLTDRNKDRFTPF